MIESKALLDALQLRGIGLYTGVPDSLLSSFCAYVDDHAEEGRHIIAANEGNAVAIACGHHLATGQTSLVYLQNSGLGNMVNPLASLADPEVYRIPMLLVIGWRGEPGVHDEPQHVKQGRITKGQLDLLEIPYVELEASSDVEQVLQTAFDAISRQGSPAAILVHKDAFAPYKTRRKLDALSSMKREEALGHLFDVMRADDLVVSTTGKTSREVYELRSARSELQGDFLTVGGMGHTASIALGVAKGAAGRRVVCIDGDGSALMHMGAMAIIGQEKPANLIHVLLNNGAHESVGGQPTVGDRIDFGGIARACGYEAYRLAASPEEIAREWAGMADVRGPVLLEVRITIGSRSDLGRPTSTPEQNKQSFMAKASRVEE